MTTIVCIGDSITFGQHLPFGVPAWPERIGAVGRGISGETTRQALERWPRDVQDNPADITVIQYGHNDANRWDTDAGLPRVSLAAFTANLEEMIDRCRAFHTRPVLCTPTPTRKNPDYDDDVLAYACALISVAIKLDVQLVDVRDAFYRDHLGELLLDDGLHLTDAGHALYADTVEKALVGTQVAA